MSELKEFQFILQVIVSRLVQMIAQELNISSKDALDMLYSSMLYEKIDFLVYCIENYKNTKGLKGREAIDIFNRYRVIDYIDASYEALHTTGKDYIVEDLDIYIEARKKLDSGYEH